MDDLRSLDSRGLLNLMRNCALAYDVFREYYYAL